MPGPENLDKRDPTGRRRAVRECQKKQVKVCFFLREKTPDYERKPRKEKKNEKNVDPWGEPPSPTPPRGTGLSLRENGIREWEGGQFWGEVVFLAPGERRLFYKKRPIP